MTQPYCCFCLADLFGKSNLETQIKSVSISIDNLCILSNVGTFN